jgi:uncharacterized protein YxjI
MTLEAFFQNRAQFFIRQVKEWVEILIDWETTNKYRVYDPQKQELGFLAERGGGLFHTLKRAFFRSHRPFDADLLSPKGEKILHFQRPFFWIWSDLEISNGQGKKVGSVHRRFAFFYKKYDLMDVHGHLFARLASPFWRIWKFPLLDAQDNEVGQVSKKWGGVLREIFTDADAYLVDYGNKNWSVEEKAVIFGAALSIDFDYFENNAKRGGLMNRGQRD